MKKTYRNALRSKAMIRQAFIELLAEKPLEQITVVDIVKRSDLSRNTFYAHYPDVYAVLEEFQYEALDSLNGALDEAIANQTFDDPQPFLQKVADYVCANREIYRVLLNAGRHDVFVAKMKELLIHRITEHMEDVGIRDRQGLLVFIEVLSAGFVHLVQQYLREQTELSSEEIAREISRIFRAALPLYKD